MNLQPELLQDSLIEIRPLKGIEFEELYAIASDPLIWEVHPAKDRYKREVFKSFFDAAANSKTAFLIYDKKKNKLIGTTRFYDYNPDASSIAIGYTFLAREYWGGVYNTSMKTLLLNYAFQYVDRVMFHIGAVNIRSQKALLKLGGNKLREYYPESSTTSSLYFEYEITKQDWELRSKA